MKNELKIKNITKLIAFCLSSLILIYFSKYVFGNGNEIKIEKRIVFKSSELNNVLKGKLGSFHIGKYQNKINIKTGEIIFSNAGNQSLRPYGITAENISGNDLDLVGDFLSIYVEIDGIQVYSGKLSDIFTGSRKYFKIIKKIQPNTDSKMSMTIINNNTNSYKTGEYNFDLYILATSKDNLDVSLTEKKNRMYIGGFYSQDCDKYINEFWGECLQKEDVILFYYNKTSYNKGFEYVILDIKNKNSKRLEDMRIVCFKKFKMISVKGILEESVIVDWENNIIKIKKSALSQYGSCFDVRIGSAETMNSKIQLTSYKTYSLAI